MPIPIVDSHIHLFPESHLPTLAWHGPNNPLGSQHSVDEYRAATAIVPTSPDAAQYTYLRGFIFLETDRISSVEESGAGWSHALDEVSLLTRIALGNPIAGEGHRDVDRHLCLGIVPWAPVPGGPAALEKYLSFVKERTQTEEVWRKVRGVRYLVQDKPSGVMLSQGFIDGLKYLGSRGLTFDLGVDARQGGLWQLREAVEMMKRIYDGVDGGAALTLVINHLCKPNLRLPYSTSEPITSHPEFLEWKSLVRAMAQYPTTYMKLSGGFSELPPLASTPDPDIASLVDRLQPWTDVILEVFGPERVMFGSDWPVCNIDGGGNTVSWSRWKSVVENILERRGLTEEQKKGVWGEVAAKAYGIKI
ncbi:hypothetical protein Asppvi_010480 [Aspergillus pseudoviridinutans]|uniref:Amidohydrolase-related domain-containing protein n=1 Tax=Aspergillus pseudoviridinutans TaxID=1517512 RepID=A0A9P3BM89_9EURO|nr:uncharacterized protein Asppvi_010480 [Aspergillus pseudoviridinutans]GIJ91513.1 hypothetical protein Asppvi_010480 [Aspergillus pseudoviridinutans]